MTTSKSLITFYRFDEWPGADSCWSLSTGPDGRIYAAACVELEPGSTVCITRYNDTLNKIDYLLEMDKVVNDPRDSGRATQCKAHYSFAPSLHDGIMYMATHLSGSPINHQVYNPWHSWDKPEVFRGSALVAFDTNTDKVLWHETMFPKEGCRCLCHDEKLGYLYALTYPWTILWFMTSRQKRLTTLVELVQLTARRSFLIPAPCLYCQRPGADYSL